MFRFALPAWRGSNVQLMRSRPLLEHSLSLSPLQVLSDAPASIVGDHREHMGVVKDTGVLDTREPAHEADHAVAVESADTGATVVVHRDEVTGRDDLELGKAPDIHLHPRAGLVLGEPFDVPNLDAHGPDHKVYDLGGSIDIGHPAAVHRVAMASEADSRSAMAWSASSG